VGAAQAIFQVLEFGQQPLLIVTRSHGFHPIIAII
jgi:hypothetical protein